MRRESAEGRPVVIEGGRAIDPEDVLGPPSGRNKLVVIGDIETTEGLRYDIVTDRGGAPVPWTIAGPTCDSVDVCMRDEMLPAAGVNRGRAACLLMETS